MDFSSRMLQQQIEQLAGELEAARLRIAQLEKLVELDPLCNVLNRRGLERALYRALERQQRYGERAVFISIDLDGFKSINDAAGHDAGDEALKFFAATLQSHCRSSDVVARPGGDEFALLMPHASLKDAQAKIADLRHVFESRFFLYEKSSYPLLFSAGTILLGHETPQEAMRRVDLLMYADKKQRRCRLMPEPAFLGEDYFKQTTQSGAGNVVSGPVC